MYVYRVYTGIYLYDRDRRAHVSSSEPRVRVQYRVSGERKTDIPPPLIHFSLSFSIYFSTDTSRETDTLSILYFDVRY